MDEKIENCDGDVTTDAPSAPWLVPYRWKPGQTGNPGGRLGKLAQRVREATHDGEDLINFFVKVMNDETEETKDRLRAASELASRGWGRPPQFLAIQKLDRRGGQADFDRMRKAMEAMPVSEVRELMRLLRKVTGNAGLASLPGPKCIPAPERE